jgi:hypothetical protein
MTMAAQAEQKQGMLFDDEARQLMDEIESIKAKIRPLKEQQANAEAKLLDVMERNKKQTAVVVIDGEKKSLLVVKKVRVSKAKAVRAAKALFT